MYLTAVVDPIASVLGEWSAELSVGSLFLRIALAVLCAAVIGCERSGKRHAAGLRTFILVALSSCLAMITDLYLCGTFGMAFCVLSAAVVIGVSVITVNSILYSSRNQVKGLTTAFAVWSCGILGLVIGAGLYLVTVAAFVALLCNLALFPDFERYLKNRSNHFELHLELRNHKALQDFTATVRELGIRIDDIELNPAYANSGLCVYSVSVSIVSEELKKYKTHKEIIEALRSLDYIAYVEEMS